jgi:PAS domain S-box-containing protein
MHKKNFDRNVGTVIISFVMIVVTVVAVDGVTYYQTSRAEEILHWKEHTFKVLSTLAEVRTAMLNIDNGRIGYLSTGNVDYLAQLYAGREEYDRAIDQVIALVAANTSQQLRLAEVHRQFIEWYNTFAIEVIRRATNEGPMVSSSEDIAAQISAGKNQLDTLRELIREVNQSELVLQKIRNQELQQAQRGSRMVILAGAIVIVLAIIVIGYVSVMRIRLYRRERSLAESALNQERLKLRTIIDTIPDSIYVKDKEYRKIVANKTDWQYSGAQSEAEVLGKTDFDTYPQELAQQFYEDDRRVIEMGESLLNREEMLTGTDGMPVWLSSTKLPLRNKSGEIVGLVGVGRDITEQKVARQGMQEAKERAEAASKAKSEFLANMSHEIRTPLNGVIGFTELLRTTRLTSVQQQYVDNAVVSGHNLLRIISDILDFSKIEAGMLELEFTKTDMHELLGNSVDIIKYAASEKKIELLLHVDPKLPRFAIVDSVRLTQILMNLLSNAVKFTAKGEVELKVRYSPLDTCRGRIRFEVRDTGIGISDEQKNKLFKAFSQADSSTTRRFGGTGLGLIISRKIAEQMGAEILFDSRPGEGSVFYFELETQVEESQRHVLPELNLKRCLIVDDNAGNRTILEHQLSCWGIATESCEHGEQALDLLRYDTSFDAVLCDYRMPVMDGLQTIQAIRELPDLCDRELPVVLLHSSSDDAELHRQSDRLHIQFTLTKPVKSDDLLYALRKICRDEPETEAAGLGTPTVVSATQEQPVAADVPKLRILVAEDVAMNLKLIVALLKSVRPGVEVLSAENGVEAVELFRSEQPDLILMDVQMPEMDGLEATREIRSIENERRVPIIALTAAALKEDQQKCIEAGMDSFMSKPVEISKLKTMLETYLDASTAALNA